MKNQLGPWRRSSIKAGEPNTPMVQDCLTALPLIAASAAKTLGVAVVTSKPITQGSISYHIEKDGVVTDTVTLVVGQSGEIVDTTPQTFPEETRSGSSCRRRAISCRSTWTAGRGSSVQPEKHVSARQIATSWQPSRTPIQPTGSPTRAMPLSSTRGSRCGVFPSATALRSQECSKIAGGVVRQKLGLTVGPRGLVELRTVGPRRTT